jgi:hypothetical protein
MTWPRAACPLFFEKSRAQVGSSRVWVFGGYNPVNRRPAADGWQMPMNLLSKSTAAALKWDDFICGFDTDDDIADAGDDILVSDTFASNVISLTYDDNGNLTDDGLFKFTYNAWNRMRYAKLAAESDTTDIGRSTFRWDDLVLYTYRPGINALIDPDDTVAILEFLGEILAEGAAEP